MGPGRKQTILLLEDDKGIVMGLEYSLVQEGFEVTPCGTVAAAMAALDKHPAFSLALLDLALPDGNGYEVCREIKRREAGGVSTPVIFLTARDDEVNVVMGLDMGADDYVTKPFRVRELISRIRSVLRPAAGTAAPAPAVIEYGDVRIHTDKGRVTKGGQDTFLTALEYRLLMALVNNEGQVLSRSQLLESIWDISGDFVNDNTLTVYIKRLREKIEDDPQNPRIIQTVRGLGYMVDRS